MPGVFAVLGQLDGEALAAKTANDEIREISLIFDNQNPNAHKDKHPSIASPG